MAVNFNPHLDTNKMDKKSFLDSSILLISLAKLCAVSLDDSSKIDFMFLGETSLDALAKLLMLNGVGNARSYSTSSKILRDRCSLCSHLQSLDNA